VEIPLSVWREQLKRTILRLRQHPSLAVYTGGNEFMPYQEFLAPYLGIARELVAGYDNRPFRMSSPGGSDSHAYGTPTMDGGALWGGDPNWYVKLYAEDTNFISEWSYWTYANMSLFKRITPREELGAGSVGYDAKKFLAAHPTIHDHADGVEIDSAAPVVHNKASWYGDLAKADLEQLVEYSQMAQADVYGYVFEHWRSQFPYKGGEVLWTYNSHAPDSYWNIMDWFGQPQIAYYSTKRADEPAHVMANVHFFTWAPGDTFRASVYGVNDGTLEIKDARIEARILDWKMRQLAVKNWATTIPPNGVRSEARELTLPIPAETPPSYLFLELTMTGASAQRLSRRAYWIRVVELPVDPAARSKQLALAYPAAKAGPWLKPQIEGSPTEIGAELVGLKTVGPEAHLKIVLKNTGRNPAYPVRLSVTPDVYSTIWSDNYFWLDAGESVSLEATIRLDMAGLDPLLNPKVADVSDLALEVSAWNARGINLSLKKP
jgi:beta-mannosidase